MKRLLVFLLFASPAFAQAHSNTFSWAASASSGVTGYNVYKATGTCSATATFIKLTITPQTALTFTDSTPTAGQTNCYYVTAVSAGGESGQSSQIQATTPMVIASAVPLPPPSVSLNAQ